MDTNEDEIAILSDLEKLQKCKVTRTTDMECLEDYDDDEDIADIRNSKPGPSFINSSVKVDISGDKDEPTTDLDSDALRALEHAQEGINLAEQVVEDMSTAMSSSHNLHLFLEEGCQLQPVEKKVFATPGAFPFGELEFSDTTDSVYEPIGKSFPKHC